MLDGIVSARAHLPRMVLFARVVEHGSFSAAARALGLSRSAVSEAISTLEEFMDCRLLQRTTRTVRPTELGELLYARCRRIADELDTGMAELEARREGPQGTLRMTAPEVLSDQLVVPAIAKLYRTAGIEVELWIDDQRRDLVREGFDLSVRVGKPRDSSMTIRRLGRSEEVLVASPAVASRLDDPEQLRHTAWVGHESISPRVTLRDLRGKRRTFAIKAAIRTNSTYTLRSMAVQGLGCALMPYLVARPELEAGRLVRVFPDLRAQSLDMFVLMPSRKHVPARVRLLLDALGQRLDQLRLDL